MPPPGDRRTLYPPSLLVLLFFRRKQMTTAAKIPIAIEHREWFRDQFALRIYVILLTEIATPTHIFRKNTGEYFFTYRDLAGKIRISRPKLINRLKRIQASEDLKIEKTGRRGRYRATIPGYNEWRIEK
jgi:hypothetical protein